MHKLYVNFVVNCLLNQKVARQTDGRNRPYFKKMINKENRAVEAKGGEKAGSNRK